MSQIPDEIITFLTLDEAGKFSEYKDIPIKVISGGKSYLDKIVSQTYHELLNIYGPVPWKVKEYINDSIDICSRRKLWDKNILINLLTSNNGFVIKYFDNTSYFKNLDIKERYESKNENIGTISKSDIVYIDTIVPSLYFGLNRDNKLFSKT